MSRSFMNNKRSLEPYCVVRCQVQKAGFWLSSIVLKPHALLKGGKETVEVFYEKKKQDFAADHVSSSVLVRCIQKCNHLLMKP